MASRLELQTILEAIPGVKKVYFQPPETVKLTYPCILYDLDNVRSTYADDTKYLKNKRYQLTVIDRNPDSEIPEVIDDMPMTEFERYYAADNLHHYVYTVYF